VDNSSMKWVNTIKWRKIPILAIVLLMTLPGISNAANKQTQLRGPIRDGFSTMGTRPIRDYRVHNVGDLWSATSNFGNYGDPNAQRPSAEYHAGSGIYYLWEGRFWFGTIVGGEYRVSHADYGNYELDPKEGSNFFFGAQKSIQDSYVEFDDENTNVNQYPIGIEVHQRSLTWSMPQYNNFIVYEYDIINHSGSTLSNFVVSWVFDCDVASGPNGVPNANIDDLVDYDGYTGAVETNKYKYDIVDPLNLNGNGTGYDEFGIPYGMAYAPSNQAPTNPNYDPTKIRSDGIYDEYQIYLDPTGPVIYKQTTPGVPLTNAAGDTMHGWLVSRNTSYMFDADNPASPQNDFGERQANPPETGFIGGRLIYTSMPPYHEAPEDTMIRPYVHQWWNWESDPGSDREKYLYMIGAHPSSQGKKFLPLPFDIGAPTFDYRYMIGTGPFMNWADGDTIKLVYAYGVGLGLQGLRSAMDNAMIAYYSGNRVIIGDPAHPTAFNSDYHQDGHFSLPIPPEIPELRYSAGNESVSMVWDNRAEITPDNFLGTLDFEGYKIYRSKYDAASWQMIYACDNRSDVVLVKDTYNNILNQKVTNTGDTLTSGTTAWNNMTDTTQFHYVKVNLPPIRHAYTDTGGTFLGRTIERPVNGLKYYYTVVAYDPDKPAYNLPSIESAKSNYKKAASGAPEPVTPVAGTAPVLSNGKADLSLVKVVPNPYRGSALFESKFEHKVYFINLPVQAKISIYTMAGDLVKEIFHNDASHGAEIWDLISRNNQAIVSGLYIYVVESGGDKKIGKMLVIR